jgi:hypothetical protein
LAEPSAALISMKLMASAADLDETRSLPHALVFIYVNWAIQARWLLGLLAKFSC